MDACEADDAVVVEMSQTQATTDKNISALLSLDI